MRRKKENKKDWKKGLSGSQGRKRASSRHDSIMNFRKSLDEGKKETDKLLRLAIENNFSDDIVIDQYDERRSRIIYNNIDILRSIAPSSVSNGGVCYRSLKEIQNEKLQTDEGKKILDQSIKNVRWDLSNVYNKSNRGNLPIPCLVSGCQKKPIHSHLISKKYMRLLGDKVREISVYANAKKLLDSTENRLRQDPFIFIKNAFESRMPHVNFNYRDHGEYFIKNMRSTRLQPVKNASQFFGYCASHDNEIYRCVEDFEFDINHKQHLFLLCKRALAYSLRGFLEETESRSDYVLQLLNNFEEYRQTIRQMCDLQNLFDNSEDVADGFYHLTEIVKSDSPSVISLSKYIPFSCYINMKDFKNVDSEEEGVAFGSMFLNIFPIKENETFICLSFPDVQNFYLFQTQLFTDTCHKDFREACLSGDEGIMYRELSNYILDTVETFYLREKFYQTLRRKGFKENLSDFTPTKELNFFIIV